MRSCPPISARQFNREVTPPACASNRGQITALAASSRCSLTLGSTRSAFGDGTAQQTRVEGLKEDSQARNGRGHQSVGHLELRVYFRRHIRPGDISVLQRLGQADQAKDGNDNAPETFSIRIRESRRFIGVVVVGSLTTVSKQTRSPQQTWRAVRAAIR